MDGLNLLIDLTTILAIIAIGHRQYTSERRGTTLRATVARNTYRLDSHEALMTQFPSARERHLRLVGRKND